MSKKLRKKNAEAAREFIEHLVPSHWDAGEFADDFGFANDDAESPFPGVDHIERAEDDRRQALLQGEPLAGVFEERPTPSFADDNYLDQCQATFVWREAMTRARNDYDRDCYQLQQERLEDIARAERSFSDQIRALDEEYKARLESLNRVHFVAE